MLFDKDPYHQIYFDKVLSAVKKRQANFIPVRLICDEAELVERVLSEDRKQYWVRRQSSKPKEFHLQLLTDPYVILSHHTALPVPAAGFIPIAQ